MSGCGELDLYLFHEGTHYRSFQLLGAHPVTDHGNPAVRFAVWAPGAKEVRLIGNFNDWHGEKYCLQKEQDGQIWTLTVPGLSFGELYKYEIITAEGRVLRKADPYAFYSEMRPGSASKVWDIGNFQWSDQGWLEKRQAGSVYHQPLNIYEMHPGSWKRKPDGSFYNLRELAGQFTDYLLQMGYTHVELLPVMEHPLDNSWGYQITGYYSFTRRYGTPQDFMFFVDCCHQKGIGVILDWVPGHFCRNEEGLGRFNGTPLFEPRDPWQSDNLDWGTYNFDLSRPEVSSFLISNAVFWFDVYHVDGLRVDAVANMLYLDYGRGSGYWVPNSRGSNENLEAVAFLRKLNQVVFGRFPGVLMIAEESTAWPRVTRPIHLGGLGFNYKWNMGWMNDVLKYMELDFSHRPYYHNLLTFSLMYAYSENFVLALSHDEVVHGKKSFLDKMPGDYWRKFANLRALLGFMVAHPGKKTFFMGSEFGQFAEWNEDQELDWHLLDYPMHLMLRDFVQEINHFYLEHDMLWELDHDYRGFRWIDPNDTTRCVLSFFRFNKKGQHLAAVINFSPAVYEDYRLGVPQPGVYQEVLNSDERRFGGSGQKNQELLETEETPWHGQPYSFTLRVPPLAVVFFLPVEPKRQ